MHPPIDPPALPFFAYGILKPGELAHFRIKPYVRKAQPCTVRGSLYVRDGLLIADRSGNSQVEGVLLEFDAAGAELARQAIFALEPTQQYSWDTVLINGSRANILWGKKPAKGSVPLDFAWSSWEDPLFTSALEVVEHELETHRAWDWNYKNTFHLQMAYLLLWTSIERYASLRYHLKRDATRKVQLVAREPAFGEMLQTVVKEVRSVQRADEPDTKVELKTHDPSEAMSYYYQVRSNMVHRGKGMPRDHQTVLSSCEELLQVFRHVLKAARAEA
jgi:gamma-glutamylcyclotransferase (GGCT)/AIG2-like uncharacterized protein YtfP